MLVNISFILNLPQLADFFYFIFCEINDLIIMLSIKTTIPCISAHEQGESLTEM